MSVVAHRTEVEAPVVPGRRRGVVHRPPTRRRAVGAPRVIQRPSCAPRSARLSVGWFVAVAAVVCAVVVGLGALGSSVGPSVPDRTETVRVLPGESLWELAGRVAPESDTSAVVARIQELNGVDAAVSPGQPLTVPFEG